ncbi:hypothetical protein L210DRAFT_3611184 [Boletus edulis BED1]|uniref:Integrase core domain-containing protein n=1 Tax=Boletus edulis BED1 TaxID=1328754 RepID=A0AAD4C1B7_BOLED|nr:hypothetical protein L210DRAFT_3611184 [Boletus edulis BED1]
MQWWLWYGTNKVTVQAEDEVLAAAFFKYHREMLTNNVKIAARLAAEYNIHMSATSVKRRRKVLGFVGSRTNVKGIPVQDAEQLVLAQMNKDPAQRHGVFMIQQKVAYHSETHLTRQFVSDVMHMHAPEGFDKLPVGIHERWAGDGHDKLYKIGFAIWAVVDDATSRWLGAWVVPSNRMGEIVAYLFLCLVEKYGGIPLQFTTECGSETTKLFGLANSLREIFHPEYDNVELPAHVYLRSVHNIAIERSWLRLRLDWGDNVILFFNKGIEDGLYNPNDPQQYELCQWIWPKLLRKDLQETMDFRNGARMRKDNNKIGPSAMSRNQAFSLPEQWGGRDCLLPVNVNVIQEIKAEMGGDALLQFTSAEFSARAQAMYDTLGITELTTENIWHVFQAMYPLVFP